MATEYILYKLYEKRIGKGKLPEVIRMYLSDVPPVLELTRNKNEAMTFYEEEATELAYVTCLEMERCN